MLELYNAAQNRDLDLVKFLISEGANVNEANEFGDTPLSTACYCGHTEIAKLLIMHEADIHAADDRGITVLHNACSSGDIETIRLLLAKGAKVNAASSFSGSTPLHCACLGAPPDFKRNIEAVKLLIEEGADVNAIDNRQHKPLALANRNVELIKLIIPHMLLQMPKQEKPDCLQKNQELSLFWDDQFQKINGLLQELGYQLTVDIIKNINSQQKNTTLCSLAFKFFKPPTIELNILETDKTISKLTHFAQSSRCVIL
ncbi:MAG: hypothetical protein RJA25_914 [Bacteroidota bacterium]|jgi:ankyrin repeat protein